MLDNEIRNQYLSAMGIDVWVARDHSIPVNTVVNDAEEITLKNNDITVLDWQELQNTVTHCSQCYLHKSRINSVFGSGNKQAELFIIGTIPSNEEDIKNQEFIASEGILLDNMLLTLKLTREDVYTTNLVKCKSQGHREFSTTEMASCIAYVNRQIQLVKPKVLILFGEQIAQYILKTENKIDSLTATIHNYDDTDILVIVINHPEQLLLSGDSKKQAWLALMKIKSVLTPKN
ncbi:MAG: uracil-DNA glycosylase [Gammaproteobacteria bacterium]